MNAFSLLPKELKEALKKKGIFSPTPIQEKAIPIVLRGYHALIMAPTGSGKTEAALLPVAARIIRKGSFGELKALYVTPLRALNRDIGVRALELLKEAGLNVDVWHGDTPYSRRRKIIERPPEILVTTPESLNIILVNKDMIKRLGSVEYVIIDELHELIEDKRGAELAVALERLSQKARVQRIGVSATISNVNLAKKFLGGGRFVVDIADETVKKPRIKVYVEDSFDNMVSKVKDVIRNTSGTVLIFTNTRDTAEVLGKLLKEEIGEKVAVHHGSLSKKEREGVERRARKGELKVIVATSSLELGIDIGSVKHVVQFASPRRVTNLVQRVGRAEHKPYESPVGSVVTGLKPYEAFEALVIAKRAERGNLEEVKVHENPLDVLAHQIVGILVEAPRHKEQVFDLVRRAYPFWNLDYADFEEVLSLLVGNKLISCDGSFCRATKKGEIYYRTTGMIVESKQYKVIVYGTNEVVGTLDEEFVVELEPGDTFVLGGKVWKLIGVDNESVFVEKSEGEGPPPSWEGELIPVDRKVAREVGALKRAFDALIDLYPADRESKEKLRKFLKSIEGPVANDKVVVVEAEGSVIVYNVHGGSNANLALAYALSELARQEFGSASFNTTPYHVILFLPKEVDEKVAERLFKSLKQHDLETLVKASVRRSRLYAWRLGKVLVRMGLLNRKSISLDELKKVEKALRKVYLDLPPGREALREIFVEKIDIEGAKEIVERSTLVVRRGFSEQSKWALEGAWYTKDVSSSPRVAVKEAVRLRLESREVTMVCLLCGRKWRGKVKDVDVRCACGSVTVVPSFNEKEIEEVAEMIAFGKEPDKKLKKVAEEVRNRAMLVSVYGRDALMALAGRGVGSKTAARILSDVRAGLKDLVDAIIDAEKTYVRTKRYW